MESRCLICNVPISAEEDAAHDGHCAECAFASYDAVVAAAREEDDALEEAAIARGE